MEYQKIINLLDTTSDNAPRFNTKKWIEVHDQSGESYNINKQIRFKTSMLRSNICDYSDAYISVIGTITVEGANGRDKHKRSLIFKNNAPFISCVSKISGTLIENAEDLDIVMHMCNLIEYSKNYSKISGTLWNYYKDISIDPITNSESFKYKTGITGKRANDENTKEVKFSIPLKHLSNLWRSLDVPLINCEVSLNLTWSKNCVLTDMPTRAAEGNNPAINPPTVATFTITDAKLYVPVVTLSTEDDNKLLQQLKTGFESTIKWNKYRSEMTNQAKTNNSNYLIDPAFSKVNRLFALSFENEDDRASFNKYYTPTVEIKDYNVVIDGKSFFDVTVKNKEETYEKIIEMDKNNNYTACNLLDYEYFSNNYKLIGIDLSKQIE